MEEHSVSARPHLSVVIPAYNEEQRIAHTLAEVVAYLERQPYTSELLVVDDGSQDRTAEVVSAAKRRWAATASRSSIKRFALIRYPDAQNHGKGYAVRFGMLDATGDLRLFMDADNSTTVDQIESFFPFLQQGYDAVIGSRDVPQATITVHQPWYKETAGNIGNLFIRALAVPGIRDTQAGFKLCTAAAVDDIFPRLTLDRWAFDVEILAVALRRGYRVKEAPIRWVNDPNSRVKASTYLEVLRDVVRVSRNIRSGVYDQPV